MVLPESAPAPAAEPQTCIDQIDEEASQQNGSLDE
jgi:hypothetical protein